VTTLDLRGTPCPLNYVRCRLALEKLPPGGQLLVLLDAGEPEQTVAEGLRGEGHIVQPQPEGQAGEPAQGEGVRLLIQRG
jgi:TusA-related sulfurtransferase